MKNNQIKMLIATSLILLLVYCWYLFRPVYIKKVYKLDQCKGLSFTTIEYSTFQDHGIAFVYGETIGDGLPDKGFTIQRRLNGLDGSFNAIVTCSGDTLIVNYEEGCLEKIGEETKILTKRSYYEQYDSLKRNFIGQSIKVY